MAVTPIRDRTTVQVVHEPAAGVSERAPTLTWGITPEVPFWAHAPTGGPDHSYSPGSKV